MAAGAPRIAAAVTRFALLVQRVVLKLYSFTQTIFSQLGAKKFQTLAGGKWALCCAVLPSSSPLKSLQLELRPTRAFGEKAAL